METILEQQRSKHEERERLVEAMKREMLHKKGSSRDRINSDHRLRLLLDRHLDCSQTLKDLYEDKDGVRKEEVAALSGPNEFAEFYNRLKTIKDFHKRHPNEISVPMSVEFEELDKVREQSNDETVMVEFSDEEGYGKYLDLHECYTRYVNLKGVEKVDYVTYLTLFDQLFEMPRDKKNAEYRAYLEALLDYLHDYLLRVRPLTDFEQSIKTITEEFNKKWEAGTFPGWPKETGGALTHGGAHLDLSAFSSWEELASLGLDRLKSALMALGLKCGGTLEERAQRLFSTKGKKLQEVDQSLFAKKQSLRAGKSKEAEKSRELAFLEAQVYWLVEQLSEQRAATKENVERRQARTDGERDESDAEASEPESDDDDDDVPYNPKNLPLGWDGKPIPYWLYKLHGLNISYTCEICGNFIYKGPKAFQRHFSEWRHANGMRCLGIPNTAHFANVTQIEDALSLWERLKVQKTSGRWQADAEEEYEDSQGNVVNKKTFEDLKRQGLL
ncbi:Splicing factor 3A subunit 3 [Amphibalanus amphitrite]|uniref:Splicing factor 3A subunit 3 n=1 Tax=Amphibalanus amphitrite TaxID=1232801 RepID=A0A6A4VQW0_AMPAM|nr:Splicing factor 3A subunit 3 [Amphibalanus amphitrite]